VVAVLAGVVCQLHAGHAQENQFGGQDRANAAQRMIVLGVQQAIASLPPMSGQAFSYEYDPAHDTYVRSTLLGPTALRSPQTIGAGHFSVRLATSYLELADSFAPIPYRIEFDEPSPGQTQRLKGVTKFGLNADAKVGLINLAATYGLTNRFEVSLGLPIVVVDAHASQTFTSTRAGLSLPPKQAKVAAAPIINDDVSGALHALDAALKPGGPAVLRTESFDDLGFAFNSGTQAGVGRITIGAKDLIYSSARTQLALAPEFFFPSPNEAEFAGSASAAILPRMVLAFRVADPVELHVDTGYNWDFEHNELCAVVWNAGASLLGQRITVDLGVGGAKFNQGIQWTPSIAKAAPASKFASSTAVALGDTRLGDNFVDFLAGFKLRITEQWVVSGTVNVPLNDEGFRADAVGTLALEFSL
jgi:hypothetical protein